jgi:hypothetical protein
MNKFALSMIAIAMTASGALASQRNTDPVDYSFTAGNGKTISAPLAAASVKSGGTSYDALIAKMMQRQTNDR